MRGGVRPGSRKREPDGDDILIKGVLDNNIASPLGLRVMYAANKNPKEKKQYSGIFYCSHKNLVMSETAFLLKQEMG